MQNSERTYPLNDAGFAACRAEAAEEIKRDFLRGYVDLARASGFDLHKGDVALVHEADVPQAVALIRNRDPVWVNSRLVEPGRCLFVAAHLKHLPLYHGLNG